jgi:hypothetical protein
MESRFKVRRLPLLTMAVMLAVLSGAIGPLVFPGRAEAIPPEDGTAEVAPPRMVFPSVTWDAGLVERGALITHEFTFRNTGGSDLVILSTKAG